MESVLDVLSRLMDRGYLTPDLAEAFEAAERRDHLEAPYDALADLDVPLPPEPGAKPGPSPRAAALLLRSLDLEGDETVLVVGPGIGYLAALAREVTDGSVDRVREADGVRGSWDRILWLVEVSEAPDVLDHLEDLGVLVYLRRDDRDLDLVKVVRAGETEAEMVLTDVEVVDDTYGPTGRVQSAGTDLSAILALEASLARVWTGSHMLHRERSWERSVEGTWRSDPAGDATHAQWRLARKLFHLGFILQMHGDLETAKDVYDASLGVAPSAEAYTFRGWTRSFTGDLDGAIEDCKRAIETDPSLGNPYNDIGCYLLEKEDLQGAEEWFKKAQDAERYEAPHFPYLNLARLYLRRGDEDKALRAARESARINPEDPTTQELIDRLEDRQDSPAEGD